MRETTKFDRKTGRQSVAEGHRVGHGDRDRETERNRERESKNFHRNIIATSRIHVGLHRIEL